MQPQHSVRACVPVSPYQRERSKIERGSNWPPDSKIALFVLVRRVQRPDSTGLFKCSAGQSGRGAKGRIRSRKTLLLMLHCLNRVGLLTLLGCGCCWFCCSTYPLDRRSVKSDCKAGRFDNFERACLLPVLPWSSLDVDPDPSDRWNRAGRHLQDHLIVAPSGHVACALDQVVGDRNASLKATPTHWKQRHVSKTRSDKVRNLREQPGSKSM